MKNEDDSELLPARLHPDCQQGGALTVDDAGVTVVSMALGVSPDEALDTMRRRLVGLQDPTSAAAVAELVRQVPVLESLFLGFAGAATQARRPADKALLLKAALQAQQAYARTIALLAGLALQRQQVASVAVLDDGRE